MTKPTRLESTAVNTICDGAPQPSRSARKAIAVDPEIRTANLNRLRRIEGQVRGLQRMVAQGRYCADIMLQISAVNEALRTVGQELLRNHLRHCATAAIKSSPKRAEAMYDELLELFSRFSR